MFDIVTIRDLLDAPALAALREAMRIAAGAPASVYGNASDANVAPRVRSTTRVQVGGATGARVTARLREVQPELVAHFGAADVTTIEEPQFLRYGVGDFFVAHQDGNTPLTRDASTLRRISIVIFVSDVADYDGGALVLHGRYPDLAARQTVAAEAGSLVAFRPETTHEVTPVTRGERCTIATWMRA